MTDERTPPSEEAPRITDAPAPAPSARSLRVMEIVRWLLLAVVTSIAALSVWHFWAPDSMGDGHADHAVDRYYCPMHPQIRSSQPGECPICHMNLEPIPQHRKNEAAPASAPAPAQPGDVAAVTLSRDKQDSIGLLTAPAESAALGDRLRVPALVATPETGLAQVRVRAAGFVERVLVRETGASVARGQALAYIYSPEIYRAQEEFIAASRWQGASATSPAAASASELSAAARRGLELLGLESAELDEIARTGKPLRAVPVRATAAGVVTRFNAVLGSRADPETILYEIADLSRIWVIASVHERELSKLKLGTNANFQASGASETWTGRIELIEPSLDEATRTARVRLGFKNRKNALRPGQFGEVEFELPAGEGLLVPRDAVIHTGEHNYVYVASSPERFEPRTVQLGSEHGARVQILSGLSAGDRVVTRGGFMLDSESRLQASLAAAPAASPSGSAGPPTHGRTSR